jgi:hypothetical protein
METSRTRPGVTANAVVVPPSDRMVKMAEINVR